MNCAGNLTCSYVLLEAQVPTRNSITKTEQGAGDALLKEPADLVGREVSAVAFARDGVEFHFGGPILRSRAVHRWSSARRVIAFPSLVRATPFAWSSGRTIQSLSLDEARHLEFTTSNGCRVRLPIGAGGVLHFRAEQLLQVA